MNFKRPFPNFKQLDTMDCGPTCLQIVAAHHGGNFDINYLREISGSNQSGVFIGGLLDAATHMQMDAMAVSVTFERLKKDVPLPCIIHWEHDHYMVAYKITKNFVYVSNPKIGLAKYSHKKFKDGWIHTNSNEKGTALIVRPRADFITDQNRHQDRTKLSFLVNYFKPYKGLLYQLIGGLIVGLIVEMSLPFLTQSIIDYGINFNDLSFVKIILFAQLFLYLTQSSLEIIRSWIILHVTSRVNIQTISDYILILLGMPIAFFDTKTTGDFVTRLQDHQRINKFLSASSISAVVGIIEIFFFSFIFLYFSWSLFLIFLFGTATFLYWHYIFLKKRARLDHIKFDAEAKNNSKIIQLIQGVAEIKFNASQNRRRAEWYETQKELFHNSIDSLKLKQLQLNGGSFIHNLKNIFIVFASATLVINGSITLGTMLAVMFIIGSLNTPLTRLISFTLDYQDAKLSFKRLAEIHTLKKDKDTSLLKRLPNAKALVLKDLHFKYPGTGPKYVLKDINCEFPIGKTTAIVGSSGSGKTTLLKLLLKTHAPSEGSIRLDDVNLSTIDTEAWRKKCGIVLQDGFLFSDTIKRNITESDSLNPIDVKRYTKAILIANLTKLIEQLPHRDNTMLHNAGSNLSGGELQRVLIARVVYKNPDFLFFDEATSSLDSKNESEIVDSLNSFYKDKTVVVVAHRLSTVRTADNILVLEDGNIVENGTHDQLIKIKGAYYNLVMKQL